MNTRADTQTATTERKSPGTASAALLPPVDITEDPEGITLKADLPGVSKENVAISVEGDTLSIEGVVRLGEAVQMQSVYAEVRVDRFKRSFMLSRDLDTAKIEANVRNGVLTLKVPKREQAKPRRVQVQVG